MATHHLAQFNPGRVRFPLDHPEMSEFVEALDEINVLAESSPGFVWRLTGDDGGSSSYVAIPGNDDPLVLPNLSVWTDLESLKAFVYHSDHASFLRRRREWFEPMPGPSGSGPDGQGHGTRVPSTACWWIPAGTVPDVSDAFARYRRLVEAGPSDDGWPPNKPRPVPAPTPAGPQ